MQFGQQDKAKEVAVRKGLTSVHPLGLLAYLGQNPCEAIGGAPTNARIGCRDEES